MDLRDLPLLDPVDAALRRLGTREAIPEMGRLLRDESGGVRVLAAELLGRFAEPAPVPDLMGALKDAKWYVRQVAPKALGATGISAPGGSERGDGRTPDPRCRVRPVKRGKTLRAVRP